MATNAWQKERSFTCPKCRQKFSAMTPVDMPPGHNVRCSHCDTSMRVGSRKSAKAQSNEIFEATVEDEIFEATLELETQPVIPLPSAEIATAPSPVAVSPRANPREQIQVKPRTSSRRGFPVWGAILVAGVLFLLSLTGTLLLLQGIGTSSVGSNVAGQKQEPNKPSINATNSELTFLRANQIMQEMRSSVQKAENETKGNEIARKAALEKAVSDTHLKINNEFSKIIGQPVSWHFSIAQVTDKSIWGPACVTVNRSSDSVAVFFKAKQPQKDFFDKVVPWTLVAGEHISEDMLKTLRQNDKLLVNGKVLSAGLSPVQPFQGITNRQLHISLYGVSVTSPK